MQRTYYQNSGNGKVKSHLNDFHIVFVFFPPLTSSEGSDSFPAFIFGSWDTDSEDSPFH